MCSYPMIWCPATSGHAGCTPSVQRMRLKPCSEAVASRNHSSFMPEIEADRALSRTLCVAACLWQTVPQCCPAPFQIHHCKGRVFHVHGRFRSVSVFEPAENGQRRHRSAPVINVLLTAVIAFVADEIPRRRRHGWTGQTITAGIFTSRCRHGTQDP